MTNEQITDKELKKELENGKTYKQIAREYGYKCPSRALDDKFRELGYRQNQSVEIRKYGGINVYVGGEVIEESLEKKGVESDPEPGDKVLLVNEVKENGDIVIKPTNRMWRKEENE